MRERERWERDQQVKRERERERDSGTFGGLGGSGGAVLPCLLGDERRESLERSPSIVLNGGRERATCSWEKS